MQRILLGIAIFMCLTAVGFSFRGQQATWFWAKMPFIGTALITIAFVCAGAWNRIERRRQRQKILEMVHAAAQPKSHLSRLLTKREQVVLEKILARKSNKEIAAELFVELSTVKTHINNIYKTLKVENRDHLLEVMEKQAENKGGEEIHP